MKFHPRSEWVDPRYPVTGPPMPWPAIDTAAPHYTAAVNLIDGDPGELESNLPAYLRAIHLDYLTHRPQPSGATGYSIGYNFCYDYLGGVWELRGWDITCAANAGNNDHVIAHLFLVDGNDQPTELAMAAFREMNREQRRRAGRKQKVIDHGRLPGAATACAGSGIRRVVDLGWLDDEYGPTITDPLPTLGDDMARLIQPDDGDSAVFAVSGTMACWVHDVAALNTAKLLKTVEETVHPVPRATLHALTLVGSAPRYDFPPPRSTTEADFADVVS